MDAVAKMQSDNLVTYLEHAAVSLGTDNQRERFDAGVLPEDELLQIARAELFKGFERFRRWHGRKAGDEMRDEIRHGRDCARRHQPELEVCDVTELGAEQWTVLKGIQTMLEAVNVHPWMLRMGARARVDSCSHWMTCPHCKAEIVRSVAKVSIPWAGRVLVREFQL